MKRLASVYQAEVDKRRQLIPESLTPLAQNSSDNPQLNQGLDFLNDSLGFSGEWHVLLLRFPWCITLLTLGLPGSPAQLGLGRSHGDRRKRHAHSAPVAHLNIKTMENCH